MTVMTRNPAPKRFLLVAVAGATAVAVGCSDDDAAKSPPTGVVCGPIDDPLRCYRTVDAGMVALPTDGGDAETDSGLIAQPSDAGDAKLAPIGDIATPVDGGDAR